MHENEFISDDRRIIQTNKQKYVRTPRNRQLFLFRRQ